MSNIADLLAILGSDLAPQALDIGGSHYPELFPSPIAIYTVQ